MTLLDPQILKVLLIGMLDGDGLKYNPHTLEYMNLGKKIVIKADEYMVLHETEYFELTASGLTEIEEEEYYAYRR